MPAWLLPASSHLGPFPRPSASTHSPEPVPRARDRELMSTKTPETERAPKPEGRGRDAFSPFLVPFSLLLCSESPPPAHSPPLRLLRHQYLTQTQAGPRPRAPSLPRAKSRPMHPPPRPPEHRAGPTRLTGSRDGQSHPRPPGQSLCRWSPGTSGLLDDSVGQLR